MVPDKQNTREYQKTNKQTGRGNPKSYVKTLPESVAYSKTICIGKTITKDKRTGLRFQLPSKRHFTVLSQPGKPLKQNINTLQRN